MKKINLEAIRSAEYYAQNAQMWDREEVSVAHGEKLKVNDILFTCGDKNKRKALAAIYVNAWITPELSESQKRKLFGKFFDENKEDWGRITAYTLSGDEREFRVWTDKSNTLEGMQKCLGLKGNKERTDLFKHHFDAGGKGCLLHVHAYHCLGDVPREYLTYMQAEVMEMKTITKVQAGVLYTP